MLVANLAPYGIRQAVEYSRCKLCIDSATTILNSPAEIPGEAEKRPETFLVWFTNEAKAEEFLSRGGGQLISLASARDPNAHPRVFKEFVSLYRVTPFKRDGKRVLATYDAYVA